jgi:GT2 family glycosyltransferase
VTASPQPFVSVIIIGYNGRPWLRASLESVLDQDFPRVDYEVLYVDNHSTDGSADFVEQSFPSVRVLRLPRNVGFYQAFNVMAETALGELLAAVPQDVVAHRQWLSEMTMAAQGGDDTLVVVSNTIGPESPDYRPLERDAAASHCVWVSMSRLGYVRLKPGRIGRGGRCTLAAVGCSMLKRELLSRSGQLFDGSAGHYAGDVELGLRASVVGGRVVQVPTAIVYHVGEEQKTLFDASLLARYAAGSRDQVSVFYKAMTGQEFALFLPVLLIGLPWKATQLRIRPLMRMAAVVVAVPFSPLVIMAALASLPHKREGHCALLARRTVPRFWLLRTIVSGRG